MSIRDHINLVEAASQPATAIVQMIGQCRDHFGANWLTGGNCGTFAIALSKWITETLGLQSGLAGVLVIFSDDPDPLPLPQVQLGRTFDHVFSLVSINGKEHLFDGTGKVSLKTVDRWFKKAHDEYEPDDPDDMPVGIELVKGDLGERSITVVDEGTDRSTSWQEFYQFMMSGSPVQRS